MRHVLPPKGPEAERDLNDILQDFLDAIRSAGFGPHEPVTHLLHALYAAIRSFSDRLDHNEKLTYGHTEFVLKRFSLATQDLSEASERVERAANRMPHQAYQGMTSQPNTASLRTSKTSDLIAGIGMLWIVTLLLAFIGGISFEHKGNESPIEPVIHQPIVSNSHARDSINEIESWLAAHPADIDMWNRFITNNDLSLYNQMGYCDNHTHYTIEPNRRPWCDIKLFLGAPEF